MKRQLISTSSEWSFELISQYEKEIERIAKNYGLDTYPNQIEIIGSEQMMDAYTAAGMPIGYSHWSYGKHFLATEANYQRGEMGLAYEIVINSNPCIAYLMEENSMMMQALVIAHACYGHNSFFKGNYMFRSWTDASSIIDYLVFAKNYIADCEQRYGIAEVEAILDSCHALMNNGVDRYKRPYPISATAERQKLKQREEILQSQVSDLWRSTVPSKDDRRLEDSEQRFPSEPQENLLYFLEKNSPLLEAWQREVIRIVRKIAQYFYPQRQTQVMNEGWATFWHYTILNTLYDEGLVDEGFMFEFLHSHTSVLSQPAYDSPYYSGINPYTLGFSMMTDIRRICEHPDDEDRQWFPDYAGSDWRETLDFAMRNFKDESFILQFLSPKVIRQMKLFGVLDDDQSKEIEISAIHDEKGYQLIREKLAGQYNLGNNEPNIQIVNVDRRGNREMYLQHFQFQRRPLDEDNAREVLKHLHRLWGFDVHLESICSDGDDTGNVSYHCPEKTEAPVATP